jgi:hypothetical protein
MAASFPIAFLFRRTGCLATLAVMACVGCAPGGDSAPKGEVVEIETIETLAAEKPAEPAAGGAIAAAAAARQEVAERVAAADRAIDEASRSIPTATAKASEVVTLGDPALTSGVPGDGPITVEQIDRWLADPRNFVELAPTLPLGLARGAQQITGLDTNPLTRAKVELGRQLYFDTRLSADATVSCATCHDPAMGYSAHTKTGIGIRNQAGGRNSPVSFNRILSGRRWVRSPTPSRWASRTRAWSPGSPTSPSTSGSSRRSSAS